MVVLYVKKEGFSINVNDYSSAGAAFAAVYDVGAQGVSLLYDGEDAPCAGVARVATYSPVVGERVLVLRFPGGPVILGKVTR